MRAGPRARAWLLVAALAACRDRATPTAGAGGAGAAPGAPTEDEVLPPETADASADEVAEARRIDAWLCRKRGCCATKIEDGGRDRKGRTLLVVTVDVAGSECIVPHPLTPSSFGSGVLDREAPPPDAGLASRQGSATAAAAAEESGGDDDDDEAEAGGGGADRGESEGEGEGGQAAEAESRDDCRAYEHWLVVRDGKGKLVSRQLLVETCNNGYGFAGVGEDELEVDAETRTFSHRQSGGSNWRGDHTVTLGLDPLRVVSRGESSFWTMDEEGTSRSSEWDLDTFAGHDTWAVPDCAERRKQAARPKNDGDERGPSKDRSALVIPRVQLPAAFADGGWRSTSLASCAAFVDGEKHGFTVFGGRGTGRAKDASMRVVVSARGVLYVEIADDRWTAAGPSWVKEDHLEIWLAATGTSTPPGDACEIAGSATTNPARQWGIRISDGAVFPGFGSPAPLAGVEVARAGSVARIKVPLQGFADSEVPDLTVVYSDSDDGLRQERLIATSDVERGHIDSLGHVRVVEPAEATCAADSRKKALHIVRTPLRTRWNKAIAQ